MPSVSNIDEVNFAIKREQSQAVRTMSDEQGSPLFCGKDVCDALGYTNPQKALRDHVETEDKTVNKSFTVNGTQAILVNESGLYSLILSSKLLNKNTLQEKWWKDM